MEKFELIENINDLIENVLDSNFCENDYEQYIHYVDKDIDNLLDYKDNETPIEDCTIGHIAESLYLLQDILSCVNKYYKKGE